LKYKELINSSGNTPLFISGIVMRDDYKNLNVIHSTNVSKVVNL